MLRIIAMTEGSRMRKRKKRSAPRGCVFCAGKRENCLTKLRFLLRSWATERRQRESTRHSAPTESAHERECSQAHREGPAASHGLLFAYWFEKRVAQKSLKPW